jgi:hypothetical protein
LNPNGIVAIIDPFGNESEDISLPVVMLAVSIALLLQLVP